jgi:hypothetical protein
LARSLDKILFLRDNRDLMHLDEYCEANGYSRSGFLRDMVRVVTQKNKAADIALD